MYVSSFGDFQIPEFSFLAGKTPTLGRLTESCSSSSSQEKSCILSFSISFAPRTKACDLGMDNQSDTSYAIIWRVGAGKNPFCCQKQWHARPGGQQVLWHALTEVTVSAVAVCVSGSLFSPGWGDILDNVHLLLHLFDCPRMDFRKHCESPLFLSIISFNLPKKQGPQFCFCTRTHV